MSWERRVPGAALLLTALVVAGCGGGGGKTAAPEDPSPIPPEPGFTVERLVNPPASYGPWVRWWWPGNDVTDEELAREVDVLADAGFAGAEIQAFDAALDPGAPEAELDRRRSFGTPSYYAHVRTVRDRAAARGFTIDLTLGSGWPVGGKHVTPEQSIQTLLWSEDAVEGPAEVTLDVAKPDRPIFYVVAQILELAGEPQARWEGDRARRLAVFAYRVTGGGRSSNPLDLFDAIELDPASAIDLTNAVSAEGTLAWRAPAGRWQVVAFFAAPDGEYPLLNAEPESGYVVDHLDAGIVASELELRFGDATGLDLGGDAVGGGASPFRAIFDDSLELKTERHVSSDFVAEFRRRRGYDPTPWMPAVVVPGADNYVFEAASLQAGAPFRLGDDDDRVRHDWSRTVSELFHERWYGVMRSWSHERGVALRAQPYGAAFDVLANEGAADIPEAEQLYAGGSELLLGVASSAAALYGRNLVSAETMPWAGRDFMTTPAKMKLAADKLLAAGINQVVFHGFPYRKTDGGYGEVGWNPFSSPWSGLLTFASHVAESDPFWADQPALNRYLARAQYAMRQGDPAVDVLIYYPWLGFPSNFQFAEDHDETIFTGALPGLEPRAGFDQLYQIGKLIGVSKPDPRAVWLEKVWELVQDLDARGRSWGWVNDESLAAAEGGDASGFTIRGRHFAALAIADAPTMEPAAAKAVAALAARGVPVVVAGDAPGAQPGYAGAVKGDRAVQDAMAAVARSTRVVSVASVADAGSALESLGVAGGLTFASPAPALRQYQRRVGEGGRITFVWNSSREPVSRALAGECAGASWFDAWTGVVTDAGGDLSLTLAPWESRFLLCGLDVSGAPAVDPIAPVAAGGAARERTSLDRWTLSVSGPDVAGGTYAAEQPALTDWRDIPELRRVSSPGVYRTSVDVPALGAGESAVLGLGWVVGAADVRVNGQLVGRVRYPPFELDVSSALVSGANELEVTVTSPLRNRFIGYGATGDPAYAQFAGRPDDVMAAGLLGPAALEIRGAR